jgi:tetratricopeptide (TPR) repeat protein
VIWQYTVTPESYGNFIEEGDIKRTAAAEKDLLECSAAIRQDPDNADLYVKRSRVHTSLRAYDLAIKDLSEAMRCDPEKAFLYLYLRHKQHLFKGNPEQALADIKETVRLQPGDMGYFLSLAYVHQLLGQTDEALEALSDGIRRHPESAERYRDRAAFLEGLGRCKDALADVNEMVRIRIKQSQKPFGDRTQKYWRLFHAYHDRVSIYIKLGQFEEALTDCNACIAVEPEGWTHYRVRSEVYEAMGDTAAARRDYARSLELNDALKH